MVSGSDSCQLTLSSPRNMAPERGCEPAVQAISRGSRFSFTSNNATDIPSQTVGIPCCGRMPPSAGTRSTEMHAGLEQHEDSKSVCSCQKVQAYSNRRSRRAAKLDDLLEELQGLCGRRQQFLPDKAIDPSGGCKRD